MRSALLILGALSVAGLAASTAQAGDRAGNRAGDRAAGHPMATLAAADHGAEITLVSRRRHRSNCGCGRCGGHGGYGYGHGYGRSTTIYRSRGHYPFMYSPTYSRHRYGHHYPYSGFHYYGRGFGISIGF